MSSTKTEASPASKPHQVRLPRQRLRSLAASLHSIYPPVPEPKASSDAVTVVCISDTHGTQPALPAGDLLLHAGDLTKWGTFSELQAQLTWLAQQPHKQKVVIAGNHDLLLDSNFQLQHPERWKQALTAALSDSGLSEEEEEEARKCAEDLDWGDIIYLQDSSAVLHFDGATGEERRIVIFGSPLTPQHGISAFQHPVGEDVWTNVIPNGTDILVTHGPPRGHLDGLVKRSGCAYLAREIARVGSKLVVFGHIHVGRGKEELVYDRVGRAYEAIFGGWGGWTNLVSMALATLWARLLPKQWRKPEKRTTLVNAAMVEGWEKYESKYEAQVVSI